MIWTYTHTLEARDRLLVPSEWKLKVSLAPWSNSCEYLVIAGSTLHFCTLQAYSNGLYSRAFDFNSLEKTIEFVAF